MDQKLAYYDIKGQIAIVTIDHPPMNALDAATKEVIAEVFRELDDRKQEIRAVILHGAGEKAFAAGADIKTFLELTPDIARRRLLRSHQIYSMVENFQWPVIGAIHGFCLGGGLELALCCDIRYAEETARFGFPEVNLSVFPGNGGIARSLYHLPLGKLKELVFTGEIISAAEALSLGLIEKVVPAGKSLGAALELAARIIEKGPLGVAAGKKVINRARDLSIQQGLELETELWANLTATEDMKEGARAFIEKRKPQYRGR
jgi:enoyl-CoA hydratase/carnithine racemase